MPEESALLIPRPVFSPVSDLVIKWKEAVEAIKNLQAVEAIKNLQTDDALLWANKTKETIQKFEELKRIRRQIKEQYYWYCSLMRQQHTQEAKKIFDEIQTAFNATRTSNVYASQKNNTVLNRTLRYAQPFIIGFFSFCSVGALAACSKTILQQILTVLVAVSVYEDGMSNGTQLLTDWTQTRKNNYINAQINGQFRLVFLTLLKELYSNKKLTWESLWQQEALRAFERDPLVSKIKHNYTISWHFFQKKQLIELIKQSNENQSDDLKNKTLEELERIYLENEDNKIKLEYHKQLWLKQFLEWNFYSFTTAHNAWQWSELVGVNHCPMDTKKIWDLYTDCNKQKINDYLHSLSILKIGRSGWRPTFSIGSCKWHPIMGYVLWGLVALVTAIGAFTCFYGESNKVFGSIGAFVLSGAIGLTLASMNLSTVINFSDRAMWKGYYDRLLNACNKYSWKQSVMLIVATLLLLGLVGLLNSYILAFGWVNVVEESIQALNGNPHNGMGFVLYLSAFVEIGMTAFFNIKNAIIGAFQLLELWEKRTLLKKNVSHMFSEALNPIWDEKKDFSMRLCVQIVSLMFRFLSLFVWHALKLLSYMQCNLSFAHSGVKNAPLLGEPGAIGAKFMNETVLNLPFVYSGFSWTDRLLLVVVAPLLLLDWFTRAAYLWYYQKSPSFNKAWNQAQSETWKMYCLQIPKDSVFYKWLGGSEYIKYKNVSQARKNQSQPTSIFCGQQNSKRSRIDATPAAITAGA